MKIIYFIFILFLLFVGFLPAFSSIDPVGSQWFYLSLVNFIIISFSFFSKNFTPHIKGFFKSSISLSFLLLFLFSSLSIFFSINTSESLIELSRLFILLSSLFSFYILFNVIKITKADVFLFLLAFLSLELLYFYFNLLYGNGSTKGITANVNIQAFSILFKLPLLLFYIFNNYRYKLFIYFLFFFSLSSLFIITSRGAFLGLLFILLFVFSFYYKSFKAISYSCFTLIVSFIFSYYYLIPKFSSLYKISNISLVDSSSISRITFYQNAISSIINTFPFGIGVGNWKIVSILYYSDFVKAYTVPYHVHNDFLQVAAESGLLGFFAFLFFFIFILKFFLKKIFLKKDLSFLPLLGALLVYILDSSLNFPLARPLIVLQLLFIVAYTIRPNLSFSFNPITAIKVIYLPILFLCIFSSFKVYKSFVYQPLLLTDFTDQKFDTPLSAFDNIDIDYPNITVTTLPIKSILANYYSKPTVIDSLLDLSIKENPFIKYPQALKSIQFNASNQLDSALYYAKDAFTIPKNELHTLNYFSVLTNLRDTTNIHKVFRAIKDFKSENIWRGYFLSLLTLKVNSNDSILSYLNEAKSLFPNNNQFDLFYTRFTKGEELISRANNYFYEAENDFKNANYYNSYINFMKASKLLPEDPAYLENAAHALYLDNKNGEALKLFDSVINHYNNIDGKAHYLKGLLLFETQGRKYEACNLFTLAIKRGNKNAIKAKKLICR